MSLSLPARPRLSPSRAMHVIEGDGTVLVAGHGSFVFTDPVQREILALADGTRTLDEIVDRASAAGSAAEVYAYVHTLATGGHLVDDAAPPRALPSVQLVVMPDADAAAWSHELGAVGVSIADGAPLSLVVTGDACNPALAAWHAAAWERGQRWLLVRLAGDTLWVGPDFAPADGACWECLRPRLERSDPPLWFLTHRLGARPAAPDAASPVARHATAALLRLYVERAADDAAPPLRNRLRVIDLATGDSRTHAVQQRAACRTCGAADEYARRVMAPLGLTPSPRTTGDDGGHRAVPRAETIRRLEQLVDARTGIISELRRLSADDAPMHVYTAGANPVFAFRTLDALQAGLRRASSGKGFSDAQARASALGEAIERHSASAHGEEPVVRTTLRALGDAAIDPRDVMHFSEAQYAARLAGTPDASPHDSVPLPFVDDEVTDWSPVWSCTQQRHRYLPTAWLYLGHRTAGAPTRTYADSNGCSAGNTLAEAIVQGFMELVERDATAIWWYNRVSRPAVSTEAIDDAQWDAARRTYAAMGREFWLLDLTHDLGIPTVAAVSRSTSTAREDILLGLGTHFDLRIAARRALTEMHQMHVALDTLRAGSGVHPALERWLATATIAAHPYLVPSRAPHTVAGAHAPVTGDLCDDVARCQAIVESKGMEFCVLDQSRSDAVLHAVKVIVPGMRHFRMRFAPGRLYDVPVALGWLTTPTPESTLNPDPFFL